MIKLKLEDLLRFPCEYCDQQFTHLTVNISVLLYGVALLSGREQSYIGIKCPSCLKTILIETDDLFAMFNQLNEIVFRGKETSGPKLNYNSALSRDPFDIPQLDVFIKYCFPVSINNGPPTIIDQIEHFKEMEAVEEEKLLSTLITDSRFMVDGRPKISIPVKKLVAKFV